jgi:acyl-CoA synthetase (AMP-forming)/AMP-acid ligase II
VKTKEIVAIDYMNSPKMVFIMLAVWSLGAVPALINYNLTNKPLIHCVKAATARILLVDDEVQNQISDEVREALAASDFLDNGRGAAQIVVHDAALDDRVSLITTATREPDSSRSGAGFKQGNRMSSLIFTSGTTGLPKPAIVSWQKLYGSKTVLGSYVGLKKGDIYYTCMPLYHSTATILCFCACLFTGAAMSLGHRFSNKTFWRDVRESKATHIQYVGETCRYLIAAPPQKDTVTGEDLDKKHNVKVAFGNGMRPDVWQKFKDRFNIPTVAEFYGATESPGSTFNVSSNDFSRGAIGRGGTLLQLMTSGTSAIVELDWESEEPKRFSDNNNFCKRVEPGQQGEWLFAVDAADIETKYQGYYGNSKASSSKLMRDVFTKGDAWFRSGDAVRKDNEGNTYFSDRIGDTFRWRSENVSTNEVSEALGHHPEVVEANVYGVEVPNHEGRAGCAAIQFRRDPDDQLLKSLATQVSSDLPKYAVPLFLRVMKEMASTGNNKQQKHGLRVQGIDPHKVSGEDALYWLQNGTYVRFGEKDYETIKAGKVKL